MSKETIKQQDVNKAAWNACDTFRGVMDAAAYKDYILVMLFVKYISDTWKAHLETYRTRFGGDETRLRRRLERERFVLPEGASFYDLYDNRNKDNIGELINIALSAIEDANRVKLEGVFRNIDFNAEAKFGKTRDRNRLLKMLLEDLNKPELDLNPERVSEDVIGNTYIYLIEQFASDAGKKAGEFYTPQMVSALVARLCAPKPGARICDPSCGSGGLLIEAARQAGKNNFLTGMEVNGGTWALCRMNMFLHGMDSARIAWCNTLTSPTLVERDGLMKFDNIVANPPFSLDKWGAENAEADTWKRFWRGVPPKSKGDYAFISHMVEAAVAKKGRIAVVVPHGVLFRGGAEGQIRQALIEENLLDAVVGLPGNLFPTTSIPVAILVFDRSREHGGANQNRKDVLFIDASGEYAPGKNQNALLAKHNDKILAAYAKRKNKNRYAHRATFKEIKDNDFNLNIPRYVDTFEEEEEIDIDGVEEDIRRLEKELSEVRGKMGELLKEVKR